MSGAIVVMGVSGCGKSTLAEALAGALHWQFVEGDALHPEANRRKMAAGIPLDDGDREPFLQAVAAALDGGRTRGVVASCSALKRAYRDLLRRHCGGPLLFVLPELPRAVLAARMAGRPGHFMPVSLLDSQLATLEPLQPGEAGLRIDGTLPTEAQVAAVLAALPLSPSSCAGPSP